MKDEDLSPEEKEFIRASRALRGNGHDVHIPKVTPEELRGLLRKRCALGGPTIVKTLGTLRFITGQPWLPTASTGTRPGRYPGPLVKVDGTVRELASTWKAHAEDMVERGAGSGSMTHHRSAVARYATALELDWEPTTPKAEKRGRTARSKRNEMIELPADFVACAASVVNDAKYHRDPLVNEMYRHSARFAFFTFPRMPSELVRVQRRHVAVLEDGRGTVTIQQSKLGYHEGEETITVPRELDVEPTVLTHPARRSFLAWYDKQRPQLMARGVKKFGSQFEHDYAWVDSVGMPIDPEEYRNTLSSGAKEAWPDFYPYLCREVGIIMRGLMTVQELGHFDINRVAEDSGHYKWDNLRKYVRKGKRLLRTYRPGKELDQLLYDWRQI